MALERDHDAERLARIEVLLTEAKRTGAQLPLIDRHARESISNHLDKLHRLGGPAVLSAGTSDQSIGTVQVVSARRQK